MLDHLIKRTVGSTSGRPRARSLRRTPSLIVSYLAQALVEEDGILILPWLIHPWGYLLTLKPQSLASAMSLFAKSWDFGRDSRPVGHPQRGLRSGMRTALPFAAS